LFHTLLVPEVGGDTLSWVVDAYSIFDIHRLQASQEASYLFFTKVKVKKRRNNKMPKEKDDNYLCFCFFDVNGPKIIRVTKEVVPRTTTSGLNGLICFAILEK